VRFVIIDSGVEIFRDGKRKEYPGGPEHWITHIRSLYRHVAATAGDAVVYATCPDYPDDYAPRALWLSEEVTNIERSVDNLERCLRYADVRWLAPIQGHHRDPASLLRALELMRSRGLLERFDLFGIANLCTENSRDIISRAVKYVRHWFARELGRAPRIHVFGMKIGALSRVRGLVWSFDSTAWTRPLTGKLCRRGKWSAKNEAEKELYFCVYAYRLWARHGVWIPEKTLRWCDENTEYRDYV